jgi:hypothetical protein
MKMFLGIMDNKREVTAEDLKRIMGDPKEIGPMEVMELAEVDDNGDLHFEIRAYALPF